MAFFVLLNKLCKPNILNYSYHIKATRGSIHTLACFMCDFDKNGCDFTFFASHIPGRMWLKKVVLGHKDSCHGLVTSLRLSIIVSLNFSSFM